MNALRNIAKLCAMLLLAGLAGCATVDQLNPWSDSMAVTPYNPSSLNSLKAGRQYIAQGRYELAKEQYLMALAASNDGELRTVINQELAAVDLMIQTQR